MANGKAYRRSPQRSWGLQFLIINQCPVRIEKSKIVERLGDNFISLSL